MANATRTALIADIDVYFRMAIGALLTREFGFSDVLEVRSFDRVKDRLLEHPDLSVVILDLSTPGMKAGSDLRTLRASFPNPKVVVASTSNSKRNIISTLESGVHGYLPKNLNISELTAALGHIFDGGIYVPPSLADMAQLSEAVMGRLDPARSPLTRRQMDVLELLVQGMPNKEIASVLNLGKGTVKIHLAAIFRYFGVNNRAAAVVASARLDSGRGLSLFERPSPRENSEVLKFRRSRSIALTGSEVA